MDKSLEDYHSLTETKEDVFEPLYLCEGPYPNITYGGHIASLAVKAASHINLCEKIKYHVKDKKDGQTFSYRHVVALRNEKMVFSCSVSFQSPDPNAADLPYTHYHKPNIPGPSHPIYVSAEKLSGSLFFLGKLDVKSFPLLMRMHSLPAWSFFEFNKSPDVPLTPDPPKISLWMKPKVPIVSVDQNIHRAALVFESDIFMPGPILKLYPNFLYSSFSLLTSLDHSVWFENDVDVNQWHLFDIQCLSSTSHGTNVHISRIFREDGTLVATAMQQGYIRGSAKL